MNTQEDILRTVQDLAQTQPWNHNFKLPHGVETRPEAQASHGKNLIKLDRLQPLFDAIGLYGKSVLDVGCNEGFFSIQMAEAGASVLGLDVDEKRIEKARFIKSLIAEHGNVEFENIDIYSDEFRNLPRFDVCLCLGFLHRIPDPFTAIAALADRSDMIIFEWKALKFGPHDDAFAYFSPKPVNEGDYYGTEYWLLSYAALERVLQRVGYRHFHRIDDPRQRRAILVAGKHPHALSDRPDVVTYTGRPMSVARHTKRYLKTIYGIITGKINA